MMPMKKSEAADLDKACDELLIVDAGSLRIRHVSSAALKRLGYSPSEVEGCDVSIVGPQYPRELLPAPHGLADGSGRDRHIVTEHRTRDGAEYRVNAHIRLHRVEKRLDFLIMADLAEKPPFQRGAAETALR
jgi:PAS domain S-box-containing protein